MSIRDHREQHKALHHALDELLACFLIANPDKVPSTTTVLQLVTWSHRATLDADACGTASADFAGETCAHCNKPVDKSGHVYGHGRNFCSSACLDGWEKQGTCTCAGCRIRAGRAAHVEPKQP